MRKSIVLALLLLLTALFPPVSFGTTDEISSSSIDDSIQINLLAKKLLALEKALLKSLELKDYEAIAVRRTEIGTILTEMGQFKDAEKALLEGLNARKKVNDPNGLVISYLKLAALYNAKKDYTQAMNYVELADKINFRTTGILLEKNKALYIIYESKGDYKKANDCLKNIISYTNELNAEARKKAVAEVTSRYDEEKKIKEKALQVKDERINLLEKDRQSNKAYRFRFGILFSFAGFVFLCLSIFLLYSRYNNKRKLSLELERKNTQITRSINYAKRIQGAVIPSKYLLVDSFAESFILFKPKDIVSGDFYWISNQKDKIIIAVADCTGHGIPGAFLSMIGNTLLNEIVNQKGIHSPSDILTQLNNSIVTTLGQTNVNLATQDDGMDISVCCYYKKTNELVFAGANHSLTLFKDNTLTTIKGELFSIGGFSKNFAKVFPEHTITDLKKGDVFYMFTDGYFDQFGGPNRKKFMSQRFKNLLQEIYSKPMDLQKNILERTIADWQGTEPQTDDILVVGLRV